MYAIRQLTVCFVTTGSVSYKKLLGVYERVSNIEHGRVCHRRDSKIIGNTLLEHRPHIALHVCGIDSIFSQKYHIAACAYTLITVPCRTCRDHSNHTNHTPTIFASRQLSTTILCTSIVSKFRKTFNF